MVTDDTGSLSFALERSEQCVAYQPVELAERGRMVVVRIDLAEFGERS